MGVSAKVGANRGKVETSPAGRLSSPPTPTFEQSLRLGAKAMRAVAHNLAFDANRFERLGCQDRMAVQAFRRYHDLRQAADLLDEQADDLRSSRLGETLKARG